MTSTSAGKARRLARLAAARQRQIRFWVDQRAAPATPPAARGSGDVVPNRADRRREGRR